MLFQPTEGRTSPCQSCQLQLVVCHAEVGPEGCQQVPEEDCMCTSVPGHTTVCFKIRHFQAKGYQLVWGEHLIQLLQRDTLLISIISFKCG